MEVVYGWKECYEKVFATLLILIKMAKIFECLITHQQKKFEQQLKTTKPLGAIQKNKIKYLLKFFFG